MKKEEYDDEPVYYCKRCLSLNIREVPLMNNQDYCENCGAVDIGITSIEKWEEMYREKYGKYYVEKKEKPLSRKEKYPFYDF